MQSTECSAHTELIKYQKATLTKKKEKVVLYMSQFVGGINRV